MAREIVLAARMGERVLAMTDKRDRRRRMVSRRRRDQFCETHQSALLDLPRPRFETGRFKGTYKRIIRIVTRLRNKQTGLGEKGREADSEGCWRCWRVNRSGVWRSPPIDRGISICFGGRQPMADSGGGAPSD
ncbi:hypothetical protein IG631_18949 [Alternaria alternata]|nr:hypothetical protein IG631_18949 [Alternaria alternata]